MRLPRKFAEIHLIEGKFGSGIAAHEIQHVINHWCEVNAWTTVVHDEKIARLARKLTRGFWNGFYEHYH